MAKKKAGSPKGSRKTNQQTRYVVTVLVLGALIAAALYFSMRMKPAVREEPAGETDTVRLEEPVRPPLRDTFPPADTVRPSEPPVEKPDTLKRPPVRPEPSESDTVRMPVPNAYILTVPAIPDHAYVLTNTDGRFISYYVPEKRQPAWVAYVLTRDEAKKKGVERSDKFVRDREVLQRGWICAEDADYKRSGYDRGHLVPSADRDDSARENRATFLYSNIAPQRPRVNRYVWKDLESQVRRWAIMYDSLCVVTGGVLKESGKPVKVIGPNRIAVPEYFYKVLLAKYRGKYYAVGFIVPNTDDADSDFKRYTVPVDQVETVTGIDFFPALPDSIEREAERAVEKQFWY